MTEPRDEDTSPAGASLVGDTTDLPDEVPDGDVGKADEEGEENPA